MRLCLAICLLVILICVTSISGRRKGKSPRWKKDPSLLEIRPENITEKQIKEDVKKIKKSDESSSSKKSDDSSVENESSDDGKSEEDESEEDSGDESDADEDEEKSEKEKDNITYMRSEEFKGDTREELKEKGIFYSMESIKEYFSGTDFFKDAEVENMFKRYNESEEKIQEKLAENPNRSFQPFYVVEGVDPDTRRKVAQTLAHRLKGLWLVNQPRVTLGPVFKNTEAKRAYYGFSKYMIANKAKLSLFNRPIVIERYWMDHAAFLMAKVWNKASKLPKPGSEVYKFPEDLLVPDITFAIFNTPPPKIGKEPSKNYLFEQRMLLIYKRFTGAKVHIIRFPESAKMISEKIDLYMHGMGLRLPQRGEFHISVENYTGN